jgi:hypothetical protein
MHLLLMKRDGQNVILSIKHKQIDKYHKANL